MNSKNYKEKLSKNGFVYYHNKGIYSEIIQIRNVMKKFFDKEVIFYQKIKTDDFRRITTKALKELYKTVNLRKIQIHFSNVLAKILGVKSSFYISSYVALLIARPIKKNSKVIKEEESHGFHRETFYALPQSKKYVKHQINIWTPIFDVKENQNMMYVPMSHKIKDKKIKTISLLSKESKKNSVSHKLGYLYAPKKIIGGVNLHLAKRFKVPKNNFLIFNSNLIHGNGVNLSKKIRFAFAVGLVREKYIPKNIPVSFRTGKPQFVKIA